VPAEPTAAECEFFLVQYVPDPVRGELLNIGVLLFCFEKKFLGCLLMQNFRQIQNFHARADLQFFADLQEYFEQRIEGCKDQPDTFLREIQGYSNIIQISPPRKCLASDPKAEILRLYDRYVA
jgi:Protein of unknown function (DUF3037)